MQGDSQAQKGQFSQLRTAQRTKESFVCGGGVFVFVSFLVNLKLREVLPMDVGGRQA